jgi:hypothetical protein
MKAIKKISKQLRCATFSIKFTDQFPENFDLADPFPKAMFKEVDGKLLYSGNTFREFQKPATWATDDRRKRNKDNEPIGKPAYVLRDWFTKMWVWVQAPKVFVCRDMPEISRDADAFNEAMGQFSDVRGIAQILRDHGADHFENLAYRPDLENDFTVTTQGNDGVNCYVKCQIASREGNPKPFLDFINYLFVNETERHEVLRWIATLIAKPEIRIGYALLLVSERQGIGKTLLSSHIIAPLVGSHNVSYPSNSDISGSFTGWQANKRLVVANEIYSGSSWAAYHSLKSVITDRDVRVNEKYQVAHLIENWCHVIACSNKDDCLKMDQEDRRWFYPEMTEVPWPAKEFTDLRAWLESGGLQIVKHWAENWKGGYIHQSEQGPMTERKKAMIQGSLSEVEKAAVGLAVSLSESTKAGALFIKEVRSWAVAETRPRQGEYIEKEAKIKREMVKNGGVIEWKWRGQPTQIKFGGLLHYLVMNQALMDELAEFESKRAGELAASGVVGGDAEKVLKSEVNKKITDARVRPEAFAEL